MKKKSIIGIILGIAIVLLLSMHIITNATSFSIGSTVNLGLTTATVEFEGDGKNLMNSKYLNYYCSNEEVDFGAKGTTYEFKNIARVTIKGDTATVYQNEDNALRVLQRNCK